MPIRNAAFTLVSLAVLCCATPALLGLDANARSLDSVHVEHRGIKVDEKPVVNVHRDNIPSNFVVLDMHHQGWDVPPLPHSQTRLVKMIANDEDRLWTCCIAEEDAGIWDGTADDPWNPGKKLDKSWAINQLATRCTNVCEAGAGWSCAYSDACKTSSYRTPCTKCEGRELCSLFRGQAKEGSQSC